MAQIEVVDLFTYPIKSCAGISVAESNITRRGLEHDRDFMVVDSENRFLSQRTHPELALVVPAIGEKILKLSAPGLADLEVSTEVEADRSRLVQATVHKHQVWAQPLEEEASEWFSEYLGERARLLVQRPELPNLLPENYQIEGAANRTGFADQFPISLASIESLRNFNQQLLASGERPRCVEDVRPNILVAGGEDYAEDYWRTIKIGAMIAYVGRPCARCVIIENNKSTGKPQPGALKILAKSRLGIDLTDGKYRGAFFMQNLNHIYEPDTTITVNDPIQILEAADQPNWEPAPKKK